MLSHRSIVKLIALLSVVTVARGDVVSKLFVVALHIKNSVLSFRGYGRAEEVFYLLDESQTSLRIFLIHEGTHHQTYHVSQ